MVPITQTLTIISDEDRIKDRRSWEYKRWHKGVKERDKWACILCGHNSRCVAHHLNSYMAHPKERYTLENGVTLCRQHHKEFHQMFGNQINFKEQFEEYKGSLLQEE